MVQPRRNKEEFEVKIDLSKPPTYDVPPPTCLIPVAPPYPPPAFTSPYTTCVQSVMTTSTTLRASQPALATFTVMSAPVVVTTRSSPPLHAPIPLPLPPTPTPTPSVKSQSNDENLIDISVLFQEKTPMSVKFERRTVAEITNCQDEELVQASDAPNEEKYDVDMKKENVLYHEPNVTLSQCKNNSYHSINESTTKHGDILWPKGVAQAQDEDRYLRKIKERILSGKKLENYTVENDILKRVKSNSRETSVTSSDELPVVVPKNNMKTVIHYFHERSHGTQRILEHLIRKYYYMPNLVERIEDVTSNCVHCTKIRINRAVDIICSIAKLTGSNLAFLPQIIMCVLVYLHHFQYG